MWYGGTRDQRGLLLAGGGELERAHHVRRHVAVAQHGGLRLAGRSRREQHDGDVVGVEVGHEVGGVDVAELLGLDDRQPVDRRRRAPTMSWSITAAAGAARVGDAHEVDVGEPVVQRRERGAGARRRRTASPGRPAS